MKVKWGVIGAGGIADRRTIPGMMLANNAELWAVMEVDMDFAERLRRKYNAKAAYDDAEKLVWDPDVQAVYIASPVVFHKEQVLMAAKAKKHILVEKPVALTARDGEQLVEVCRRNDVLFAAGFMMRFHDYNRRIRELLQEGAIGQLVSCNAQFSCWYPDMPSAWRQIKSQGGGGALMDMGIHCIDLIQYMTGYKIRRLAAFTGTKTFSYEVEDSSTVMFELENGAYGHVDSHFNIPDEAAKWRMEFYGTKGKIIADETIGQVEGGTVQVLKVEEQKGYDAQQDKKEVIAEILKGELGNMYTKEIQSFSDSILYGKQVEVPAWQAVEVQRIVEAAYTSSENGTFVEV
ncbi:MAG TPA: Gfo/Idh/MocA family oxidoreductase [Clostridiales bacterium]|nr:Gfo/Idh/MocA family oxidoreductase [Clostridiales bacterium]